MKAVQLDDVLRRHAALFKDELGILKGYKAKIYVKPEITPKFCRARSIPYSMVSRVERELTRLQERGILEPVEFSDWAAPIVPVLKSDKSVRICGDFSVTVNQASKLDCYPLPKVNDLFTKLVGGKTFTKLDLREAYLQIELEEESKQYVTINTHKGLFKFN